MAFEGLLFRTDGDWGDGTGVNLTAAQVDTNFYTLAVKVKDLQDNPPAPIEIGSFQVVGSQMKVFLTDGSFFGPFTLPVATFNFRSDWLPGVQYYELDLVSVAGQGLFLVRLDHVSDSTFDPNATDGDGHALYLKVFGDDVYTYTFGFFFPGTPGTGLESGDMIFAHLFNEQVSIPADAAGSYARLRVAPDALIEITLYQNDTAIGLLSFDASDPEGVVSFDNDVVFEAGDVFYAEFPTGGLDASARDLTLTIRGTRGGLGS